MHELQRAQQLPDDLLGDDGANLSIGRRLQVVEDVAIDKLEDDVEAAAFPRELEHIHQVLVLEAA